MIDWVLSLLASSFFADPRSSGWPPVAVLIVVNTVFIGLFGQTPGMALARLRCVSVVDRGAVGLIPAVMLDELRRGLHDRAAGSIVIAAPPRTVATPDPA
jgi:uncharacterized RDD family membrane protein YckC